MSDFIPFDVDQRGAIVHLALSQSKDPVKGISELVMNAVDHGATQVNIIVNPTSFVVKDNGSGLSELSQFKTFCLSQTESKKFGRFRLGRAVIMGLASAIWTSGNQSIAVTLLDENGDVRQDIGFELSKSDSFTEGTKVEGTWYNEQLSLIARDIGKHLSFLPLFDVEIVINGRRVIPDISDWDYEDDRLYIHLHSNGAYQSRYYNQGVLISEEYSHFGKHFTVVFKEPPPVNVSRNEIAKDSDLYLHMQRKMEELGKAQIDYKNPSQSERYFLLNELKYNFHKLHHDEIKKLVVTARLGMCAHGAKFSLYDLIRSPRFCIVDPTQERDKEKCRMAYKRGVFPLTHDELAELTFGNCEDPLATTLEHFCQLYWPNEVTCIEPEEFAFDELDFSIMKGSISKSELSTTNKALRNALQYVADIIAKRIGAPKREILFGTADLHTHGWTDSCTTIWVNIETCGKALQSEAGLLNLVLLLIHEYTHRTVSSVGHPPEFYEAFHDTVINIDNLRDDVVFNGLKSLKGAICTQFAKKDITVPEYLSEDVSYRSTEVRLKIKGGKVSDQLKWFLNFINARFKLSKGIVYAQIPADSFREFTDKVFKKFQTKLSDEELYAKFDQIIARDIGVGKLTVKDLEPLLIRRRSNSILNFCLVPVFEVLAAVSPTASCMPFETKISTKYGIFDSNDNLAPYYFHNINSISKDVGKVAESAELSEELFISRIEKVLEGVFDDELRNRIIKRCFSDEFSEVLISKFKS